MTSSRLRLLPLFLCMPIVLRPAFAADEPATAPAPAVIAPGAPAAATAAAGTPAPASTPAAATPAPAPAATKAAVGTASFLFNAAVEKKAVVDPPKTVKDLVDRLGDVKIVVEKKDPPTLQSLLEAAAKAHGAKAVYFPSASRLVAGVPAHHDKKALTAAEGKMLMEQLTGRQADGTPRKTTDATKSPTLGEAQMRAFFLAQGVTIVREVEDLMPAVIEACGKMGKPKPSPDGSKNKWYVGDAKGELAVLRVGCDHWQDAAGLFALADGFAKNRDTAGDFDFSNLSDGLAPAQPLATAAELSTDEKAMFVSTMKYGVLQKRMADQVRHTLAASMAASGDPLQLALAQAALRRLAEGPPNWQVLRDNPERELQVKKADGTTDTLKTTQQDWLAVDGLTVETEAAILVPMLTRVVETALEEARMKAFARLQGPEIEAQAEHYPSCDTAVTLRSPLALLMIKEIIGRMDLAACLTPVPLDGDGHFVLSFPLSHAWSQSFKYYRPYDVAGSNPPASVDGILPVVTSVVENYRADKKVTDKAGAHPRVTDAVAFQATAQAAPLFYASTSISKNLDLTVRSAIRALDYSILLPPPTDATPPADAKPTPPLHPVEIMIATLVNQAVRNELATLDLAPMRAALVDQALGYNPLEKKEDGSDEPAAQHLSLAELNEMVHAAAAPALAQHSVGANVDPSSGSAGRTLAPLASEALFNKQMLSQMQDQKATREPDVLRSVAPALVVAAASPSAAAAALTRTAVLPSLTGGTVTADVANNSLLMVVPQFDPGDVFDFLHTVDALVTRLDQPADMVEVSVAVVDIVATKAEEWGVRFASLGRGPVDDRSGFAGAGFNSPATTDTGVNAGATTNGLLSDILSALPVKAVPPAKALPIVPLITSATTAAGGLNIGSLIVGNSVKLAATLHALEARGDGQTLSRPSVLTMDNTEAVVTEETKIYLPSVGLNAGVLSEVPVGLSLAVTPQVMYEEEVDKDGNPTGGKKSRSVRLRIRLREGDSTKTVVNNVEGTVSIDNSQLKTLAVVGEGQSLLIAGRLRQEESSSNDHVPLLGRIPILGLAFKHKDMSRVKRQRLVLITPTIVAPGRLSTDLERRTERAFGRPSPPLADK